MIIVRIIKLTIRILVLVVVVLMTVLKIMNRRVKSRYIIRPNTDNPIQMNAKE
jgi:hypothetical protein